MDRSAGVILHPSSLPSPYGIGNFGTGARQWIDALSDCGFKLWQMCPTGPTGFGDSPYQCFSAFAGNPYFIDWDAIVEDGYLAKEDLEPLRQLPIDRVDYGSLFAQFWPIVETAFQNFKSQLLKSNSLHQSVVDFYNKESDWLYAYCNFRAIKEANDQKPCTEWPVDKQAKTDNCMRKQRDFISESAEKHAFTQFLFFKQFQELKTYAQNKGIQLIGDIPIFVALDSADVWANPQLFDLDSNGQPNKVAGVPPDYFSSDGQLWGNPLFAWKSHKKDKFRWWIKRIQHNLRLYDCVRIDHFRGFESCWAVPAEHSNAINGQWEPAPGKALFKQLKAQLPHLPIIAEDLGVITPAVESLLKETGFPGMAVLQFAFSSEREPNADNPYLPHNLKRNQVVYSGTHDNNTSIAWFASLDSNTRKHVQDYLKVSGENIGWDLFRAAIASVADYALIPLQDLYSLGAEARFNNPGTAQGNWSWRYRPEQLAALLSESADYIRNQLALYRR